MDTVLLFALPLVGGLIFCSEWNRTRWLVAREEGHRLYFRAVLYGALIFATVAFARQWFESQFPSMASLEASIKTSIKPMAKDPASADALADLSITCFVAMLAGWPLAKLLNLLFRRNYWLRRAIRKDALEAFLLDAADREFPIEATMDSGKVYVGYVVAGFDPATSRKVIKLLPLMSGYRKVETHKVTFTTFYLQLYGSNFAANRTVELPAPLDHLRPEDFITVLPADRIGSCRLFDTTAYLEFQKTKPTDEEEKAIGT